MRIQFATLALLCALVAPAQADRPWSAQAALGYLATSGNSDTTNVNAGLKMSYKLNQWHHEAGAKAVGADSDGRSTAERYQLGYKAKYDFSPHNYVFGLFNFEKDQFSGYEQQLSEAVGYGRRVFDSERHVLNLEIGAGLKQSDLRDGTSEDGAILRAGGDYLLRFGEGASFTQTLALESGSGNTYLESVSALSARLVERLALVLSYTVKNNSSVPIGSEKTDTFSAISLEYSFK